MTDRQNNREADRLRYRLVQANIQTDTPHLLSRSFVNSQTDNHISKQTDSHINRQTDNRHTDRQTDKQTEGFSPSFQKLRYVIPPSWPILFDESVDWFKVHVHHSTITKKKLFIFSNKNELKLKLKACSKCRKNAFLKISNFAIE